MYTVSYFIDKFSAIPEDRWTTGTCQDDDSYCALGHCGAIFTTDNKSKEANALRRLFQQSIECSVHRINDGFSLDYNQPTAKQRILAALRDIKAKQEQVEISDPPVYVEDLVGTLADYVKVGPMITADEFLGVTA